MTTQIDEFLQTLNGGALLLIGKGQVEAYLVRVQAENVLEEAPEGTDFSILTPTQCYEFAYYTPGLRILDRIDEMPHNSNPDHADFVRVFGDQADDWPVRDVDDITGLTIHHTLSDSPLGLFQWITRPARSHGDVPKAAEHRHGGPA
jgi:hypothetical protein